jgi:hypothetical protein
MLSSTGLVFMSRSGIKAPYFEYLRQEQFFLKIREPLALCWVQTDYYV